MKTTEQIKKEIISYLTKTSLHTFLKPQVNYKNGVISYNYDYDDLSYCKVTKKNNDFYLLEDNRNKKIDIDYFIKYYGNNAKCVIKHQIFLGKKMKSIKNTKYIKNIIKESLGVLELKTS